MKRSIIVCLAVVFVAAGCASAPMESAPLSSAKPL
jgi:hypothetical protein